MKKKCSKCKKDKLLVEFGHNRCSKDGLQGWCRQCRNAYDRQSYRENRNQIRLRVQVHQYGLTPEEYNLLFAKQEGKCAICGSHQSELKLALGIDHCHRTNRVRGLLCNRCNTALGMLNDDIENLKCAILYLNEQKSQITLQES